MIEAATNYRDKAAIAVVWDSGGRSEEFCDLRLGDVSDHKHGLKISIDGKQGQRSVLLTPGVPYLRQWLNAHPASDNPTTPPWCKPSRGSMWRSLGNRLVTRGIQLKYFDRK